MSLKLEMPQHVREVSEFYTELSLEVDGTEVFIGLTRPESEEYLALKLSVGSEGYNYNGPEERRRLELLAKIDATRNRLLAERLIEGGL